jgi:TolB protein
MSKVDEELSRRFHRAERPVGREVDLFEGVARRRRRRRTLQRLEAGALAVAVLGATAGGFLALQDAFREDRGNVGDTPALPSGGRIVFSAEGQDGFVHLYSARPNGTDVEQLTHGAVDDTDFAISPDGRWITLVRVASDGSEQVGTVPFNQPDAPAMEPQFSSVSPQPAWSNDSSMIAVREGGPEEPNGTALLIAPVTGESYVARFSGPGGDLASPSWSPDGRLVFAILIDSRKTGWDLAIVSSDGTGFSWLLREAGDETGPAWSPDGSRIAFVRPRNPGSEIWTIGPDGAGETLIAAVEGTSLESDVAWSPDGSTLLVSDGEWIYRVDATPKGDVRDNFVQLLRGFSPSWQPLPAGSEPTTGPAPSVSPGPEPGDRDLGFGFQVCQTSEVSAQFDGEGSTDTAFVATRVGTDGRCPPNVESGEAYVGIDVNQDDRVDAMFGPIACEVWYCRVFAAPDLDGRDGRHELLVGESNGSVVGLGVYSFPSEDVSSGNVEVVRILVGEPDLPLTGFVTGEPARLLIGGDEGWTYRLRCEDHGPNRFIYQQRAYRPVDDIGPATVDETTLIYVGSRLDVFDARDPEPATGDNPLGSQPPDVCEATFPQI